MNHVARRVGLFLVGMGLVGGVPQHARAEEVSTQPQAALSSPTELEGAIEALSPPIDSERLTQILDGLSGLTDPAEQQRLQQLLDTRLQQAMETAPPEQVMAPPATTAAPTTEPPLSDDELNLRLQSLKLGPDATADDLRARDVVVAAIIALPDPIKRDQFFQQLEERERQAQTAVYHPTEPAQQ